MSGKVRWCSLALDHKNTSPLYTWVDFQEYNVDGLTGGQKGLFGYTNKNCRTYGRFVSRIVCV